MRFEPVDAGAAPVDWWGPVWTQRSELGLRDLIRSGLVPLDLAALLWALIERDASVVVAAGPSGAGKTTLLTALLEWLPESKSRFYARGMYERFGDLRECDLHRTAILVNEISPHLPIYLWGAPVHALFDLSRRGGQFFATCHAESVEEFIYLFTASPLRLPASALAEIDALIFLHAWREGDDVRREIERVVALRGDDRSGLEAIPLFAGGETSPTGVERAFGLVDESRTRFWRDHEERIVRVWEHFGE